MRRALFILCCLLVAGCSHNVFDPYPYSFTDPNKPYYAQTRAGADRFIQDARDRWTYARMGDELI